MSARDRWSNGPDFQIAHPSFLASLIWTLMLTLAVIGVTFALSCVTPFAALAVALAGTIRLRASLRIMIIVWLANQVMGFGLFHFPRTPNTFLWGAAISGAAIATTIAASLAMKYASSWTTLPRLGIPLLVSFAVYEMTLLSAAVFLGGFETFRLGIVAQLALINGVSLVGIVVLNEVAAALCRSWLGRIPRLVRSW